MFQHGEDSIVTVMGIDIKPGFSPRATRSPRYAVVIIRDGVILKELDDIPLHRVVKLVVEYHVDILAVDSVQEIAASTRDLARLSQVVPSWCRVVEVTRTSNGYLSVDELARRLGLNVEPANPARTAFVNAIAALNGYGKDVLLPSERTYIIVTKGRTPIQGGASTERFKRSIGASVLQLVKDVKSKLEETGLDYDFVVKKGSGGLERGLFVVYAPIEKVKEVVRPLKCKNARVVVKPAPRSRVPATGRKLVVLAVDPGTSVGIAVIDLDGNPLLVTSLRTPDREKVVELVLAHGKPVLVAVDTSKPPEFVRKLSSTLDAVLYTPERDLLEDEKEKLVTEYMTLHNLYVQDAHARDALAAALKAYRSIKPLIREVDSKIRGISGLNRDEIVAEVLKGKPLTTVLEEAFAKILAGRAEHTVELRVSEEKRCTDVEPLYARIQELEAYVKKLEEELKVRYETIRNLEVELKLASRRAINEECERRIIALKNEIEVLARIVEEKSKLADKLREKVEKLEKLFMEIAEGKYIVALKKPKKCSQGYVYVDSAGLVNNYADCVRSTRTAVLVPKGFNVDWSKFKIPVIEVDAIYESEDYIVVDSNVVSKSREIWRVIDELEAREKHEKIIKMIKEYQESRRK